MKIEKIPNMQTAKNLWRFKPNRNRKYSCSLEGTIFIADSKDDVLDFIVGIGNVANNMANSQLQFAKADAAALEKEKLYERRLKEEEKNAMLDLNIEYLAAANKEVAQDIERIYSDGLRYGTTLNEHVEMHPDFKTEEMTALLKDYGLNLNEDLSVSMGIYDSQVKAIEAAIDSNINEQKAPTKAAGLPWSG